MHPSISCFVNNFVEFYIRLGTNFNTVHVEVLCWSLVWNVEVLCRSTYFLKQKIHKKHVKVGWWYKSLWSENLFVYACMTLWHILVCMILLRYVFSLMLLVAFGIVSVVTCILMLMLIFFELNFDTDMLIFWF